MAICTNLVGDDAHAQSKPPDFCWQVFCVSAVQTPVGECLYELAEFRLVEVFLNSRAVPQSRLQVRDCLIDVFFLGIIPAIKSGRDEYSFLRTISNDHQPQAATLAAPGVTPSNL